MKIIKLEENIDDVHNKFFFVTVECNEQEIKKLKLGECEIQNLKQFFPDKLIKKCIKK